MTTINLYEVHKKILLYLEELPPDKKIKQLIKDYKNLNQTLYEIEEEYYINKSLDDKEVDKILLYEMIIEEHKDFR